MKTEKAPKNQEIFNNFEINDETVGEYIVKIHRIKDLQKKGLIPDNLQKEKEDEIDSALEILITAAKERQLVCDNLKNKQNISKEEEKLIEETEFVLKEIFSTIQNHKGVDNENQKPEENIADEVVELETATTEDTEPSEELRSYRYTSILPQIKTFTEKINKGLSEDLKEEVLLFISENEEKINYRKKVIDSDPVLDIENKEYKAINKALLKLKELKKLVESTTVIEKEIDNKTQQQEKQEKKVGDFIGLSEADFNKLTLEEKTMISELMKPGIYKKENSVEDDFENEEFTSYESIIKSIIDNKNGHAVEIFLEEHSFIIKDLYDQMDYIEKKEGDDSLNSFIEEQQKNIKILIKLLKDGTPFNKNQTGLLLNAIRSDFDLLEQNKISKKDNVTLDESKPSTEEANDSDFTPIDLTKELTLEKIAILKTNPDLFNEILNTVNLYNEQITKTKTPKKIILETLEKISNLKEESRDYISNFKENSANKKTKKKPASSKSSNDTVEDFDVIEKHIEKSKSKKGVVADTESSKIKESTEPEVKPEESIEDVRIFYTEEGRDYHEISNNADFNTWLENIEKSIIKSGNSVEAEIKSLDEWYQEYQDALPYIEKLNKVIENIQSETSDNSEIKKIAAKEKIISLLYEIHTSGKTSKDKIDLIFTEYKKSIELKQKRLELEKARDLTIKIKEERTRGTEKKELNYTQIKKILESRGRENTEENITEMVIFLDDMQNNYSKYYANKNENVTDDLDSVYSRYKSSGKKTGGKINIVKRFVSNFRGMVKDIFTDTDVVDKQNITDIIEKIRELNLVDRKTGNRDKTRENEERMRKLISFTRGQIELLIEHIQNPNSNKAELLNDEEKEMLRLFDIVYKTFTQSKYRGKEARIEAEKLLSSGEVISEQLDKTEEPKDTLEALFMNNEEYQYFEKEAKLQIVKEDLAKLKKDLAKFPKTGKNTTEWVKINNKFTQIKTTLENLGEDLENDLEFKTARLQAEELEIRHINKEAYKDLSSNFIKYEKIINSPDRTVEEKRLYIKDLLDALKIHRANKTNTKIQNGVLDDTIKRYEQVLKDIK